MKNIIFWHICELTYWKEVVDDQYNELINSGLINNIDIIYISFIGEDINNINFLIEKNSKIQLIVYSSDYTQYERLCLHKLLEFSKINDANILYIHAKGVSTRHNSYRKKNIWMWRKIMEFFLIRQYKKCLEILNDYDVVGSFLCDGAVITEKIKNETHRLHFSGNFWWSKTSYIRNNPPIREDILDLNIGRTYHLCETWILYNYPNCKYYELYTENEQHFYEFEPKFDFIEHNIILPFL